jgi:hypothetical protein
MGFTAKKYGVSVSFCYKLSFSVKSKTTPLYFESKF